MQWTRAQPLRLLLWQLESTELMEWGSDWKTNFLVTVNFINSILGEFGKGEHTANIHTMAYPLCCMYQPHICMHTTNAYQTEEIFQLGKDFSLLASVTDTISLKDFKSHMVAPHLPPKPQQGSGCCSAFQSLSAAAAFPQGSGDWQLPVLEPVPTSKQKSRPRILL